MTVTEPGVYAVFDDTDGGVDIYRVRRSRTSGNLYAMALDPLSGAFAYARGAIYALTPTHRLTASEAAMVGQAWGMCVVCGAALTDPVSVARGIGPVCAKRI